MARLPMTMRYLEWFRQRGYAIGRSKSRDIYYIYRPGEEAIEFNQIWQAQQYVNNSRR